MKKICIGMAALFAVMACTRTEASFPAPDEGSVYTFTGSPLATKIAVGDKTGTTYPGLWQDGDALDVVDAATSNVLGQATLSSGAGEATGTFTFTGTIVDGTQVRLVYPASASLSIPTVQTGENRLVTYAWSAPVTVENGAASFSLTHSPAIVKLVLSSTEYASMTLESVTLWAKDAAITGGYGIDLESGALTPGTTADYVELKPAATTTLGTEQAFYLTTLPVTDDTDFTVIVKLTDADKTVTLPVAFEGRRLKPDTVNLIRLDKLSYASNSFDWYEPVERRHIPEGFYAYGPQNTIRVAPPAAMTHLDVDVKARGEFTQVSRPAYAKVTRLFDLNAAHKWTWVGTEGNEVNDAFVAIDGKTFPLAYQIGNNTYKQGGMGQVGIYDENQRQIWAFNIWYTAAPAEIAYAGGMVQSLNLGAADYGDNWKSQGLYFQFGRPFALPWSGTVLLKDYASEDVLQTSASHTDALLVSPSGFGGDWIKSHPQDIWGNASLDVSETGRKSIMDPCPAGYRVASRAILEEVLAGTVVTSGRTVNAIVPTGIDDAWLAGSVFYGTSGSRAGSTAFFAYWANCPVSADTPGRAFSIFLAKGGALSGNTANCVRSNAHTVRCMKDTDNR